MRANTKRIKQSVAMSLILSSVLLSGCTVKIDEVSQKMMDDINPLSTIASVRGLTAYFTSAKSTKNQSEFSPRHILYHKSCQLSMIF